jgi:peptide-methionine (S)-S-oxide reductase
MIAKKSKIGFGGGCHWCTEAFFQALIGVEKVEQGWIASQKEQETFSEAVIVYFDESVISLETLIEVHLTTHNSASNHSMREKYRSAVYSFNKEQLNKSKIIIQVFQNKFKDKIITKVYPFLKFKPSRQEIQNYHKKNPSSPFCQRYIDPKLKLMERQFENHMHPKT